MPPANDVTRRTLLRCAALGAVALASGMKSRFGQTVSRPPNIVFIKANAQRAVRDGDYKYLKILDNTFLQRRRRPDGARQPEGPPEGRLRSTGGGVARMERRYAGGD